MQLVLQPCGDSDAVEHYVDTILNPVSLARLLPFLPTADRGHVSATFDKKVAVWGVTPGKADLNANKWKRMQVGDVAMLYRDKRFFFKGQVAYKVHSPDLARELWHERADGATWEYVFFLTDLEELDIDVARFNEAAGYKSNNIIQGFNVLAPDHSEAIMESLDLEPGIGATLSGHAEIQAARIALAKLDGELDLRGSVRRRAEQALLRKIILGGKKAETCALCGRRLPVDLLVVGHIRKRHSCGPFQKRDEANIMPVCLLGCDKLFENGYIHVDVSGVIQAVGSALEDPQLRPIVDELVGKNCLAWHPASAPYFKWHQEHPRRFL